MIEVVGFEPHHLHSYHPGDIDRQALKGVDLEKQAGVWADRAVTALDGQTALGFGGIGVESDGTMVGFLLLSDELRARPVWLMRALRAALPAIFRDCGLEAIECSVPQTFAEGHRWVKRLGFEFVRWEPSGHLRYRLRMQ